MRLFDAGGRKAVVRLAFTPDGRALTAQFERSPVLGTWDLGSGGYDRVRPCDEHSVTCFAYAPDGSAVGVGGDGVVRVCGLPKWDRRTELVVGRAEWWPGVAVAFAPSADPRRRWVAAAGGDLQLRNLATPEVVAPFDPGGYTGVAFGPDGELVAASDMAAAAVTVWSVKPVRERFRFGFIPFTTTRVLAWMPGADALLMTSETHLWVADLDGGKRWEVGLRQPPNGPDAAFTPDGRLLAVADGSAVVRLLHPATGVAVREYDWGIGAVTAVAFSHDGTLAAAGGERGQVVVWDLDG